MAVIFNCTDAADNILEEVVSAGIAGISGGRLSVRRRLAEVAELAIQNEHEQVIANSTVNHPETELAFLYDCSRYRPGEAQALVVQAYDKLPE